MSSEPWTCFCERKNGSGTVSCPDCGFSREYVSTHKDLEGWKAEAEGHREAIVHAAEAAGWKDLRQENGDLHLPCIEDIITVVTERLRTALQEATAIFLEYDASSDEGARRIYDWLNRTAELRGEGNKDNE